MERVSIREITKYFVSTLKPPMSHPLLNSKPIPRPNAKHLGALEPDHTLELTVVLEESRPNTWADEWVNFCTDHHLITTSVDLRHSQVKGQVKDLEAAFGIHLQKYELPNDTNNITYHSHAEEIQLPAHLSPYVTHIFGFDTAPIAKPYYKSLATTSKNLVGPYTPLQLAKVYNFPTGDGTNQKIGIIELGGGFNLYDIETYLRELGIAVMPNINAIGVDGAINNPNDPSGASIEVVLDIEIIAALAPKAAINVYFAPNTAQGFYDAIYQAILNGVSIISISWGGPETLWSLSALNAFNYLFKSAPTVTVCVASGDNGSSDGLINGHPNVDFPASSPYVLGCGGTHLVITNVSTIAQETVWNDSAGASGGGISTVFGHPAYQNNIPALVNRNRGVPDVCGDADPYTGYIIYYQGQNIVVGGTSAVAPLWSGLLARINQITNKRVGFINPILYAHQTVCHDVILGSNGAYSAQVGWDACTGLGSPNGQAILGIVTALGAVKKKEITKEAS
jgi:kumamolisin